MSKLQDRLRDELENSPSQHEREARIMTRGLRHEAADLLDECEKALRDVLPLLDMAFEAEGNVFGVMHNSATDTDIAIRKLLAKLEGGK